jgi:myo-inositol-1(or 4)-monophosphatase
MLGEARMFAKPGWPVPWPQMRVEARNSVAYRMALVAAGQFDACIAMSGKYDWDIAAADLIVAEAGGVSTDHLGRGFIYNRPIPSQKSLVCSGPALAPLLLERLRHIEL